MQKKRKAQEAFIEPKPRLSAFAAAKARAAQLEAESRSLENGSDLKTSDIQNGAAKDPAALSTLLSSFPLSSAHEGASENDDDDNGIGYSSDDQLWTERSSTKSYKSSQPRELCSFRPSKKIILSDNPNRLVLKLKADETVTFVGEYDLQVITGIITVYGAAIRAGDESRRVFAPSTHALPVITARGGAAEIAIISTKTSMAGLSQLSPLFGRIWNARDLREAGPGDNSSVGRSFILLRSSSNDPLKRALTPLTMDNDTQSSLFRIVNTASPSPTPAQPPVILVSGPKGSGKSTVSRHLTNTFLTSLNPSSSSSSSPSPSNTTISPQQPPRSMFWLDLDPGQPEFGPSGQISLYHLTSPILGPPFTHALVTTSQNGHKIIRSHTLASVSPKEDHEHFLSCALELVTHYRRLRLTYPQAPLVVNCSGWVLGSAVEVLLGLVRGLGVSDAVLMAPMDGDVVREIETMVKGRVLLVQQREGGKMTGSRSSAEFRAMMGLSYFHSLPTLERQSQENENGEDLKVQKWDTRPLSTFRPYRVKYSGPEQGVLGISSYGELVDPDFLATVTDGMVLAMCVVEDETCFLSHPGYTGPDDNGDDHDDEEANQSDAQTLSRLTARTPEGLPYLLPTHSGLVTPLDPTYSRCLGLVLVRGIDVANQELHLLTPIPEQEIQDAVAGRGGEGGESEAGTAGRAAQRIVLVRGRFDCPDWAFLEDVFFDAADGARGDGLDRPYVAERKVGGESGLGGNVWRVRHLPRKMGGDGGGGGGA